MRLPGSAVRGAACAAALLVLSGCGFSGAETGDRPLQAAMAFSPQSGWDPASDDALILSRLGVTETLVDVAPDGAVHPDLAESWQRVSPVEWRFTLAPGVRFQSGEPVTAQAAADSLRRVTSSAAPPRALRDVLAGVDAPDERTVQVRTAQPDPILPQRLATANAAVLAPGAVGEDGTVDPAAGAGTGPFEVTRVHGVQSVDLRRSDSYRRQPAHVDAAQVRFVDDASARVNGLRSGEFDLIDKVPVAQLEPLRSAEDVEIDSLELPRTTALHMNTAEGPFADQQVREAAERAVDRTGLVDGVLQGESLPAARYFGPGVPWGSREKPPAGDPAAAQRALTAATGERRIPVTIATYPERPELPALTTALADQLGRAGFDVRIVQEPSDRVEPKIFNGEVDAAVYSRNYLVDVPDAASYLASDFSCAGGFNLDHWCDPRLDALLGGLDAVDDREQRAEVFREASELLDEHVVGVPLAHDQDRIAHSTAVTGVATDPLERELLTEEVSRR
ncbi:ABC transporter substrate-binding protein [Saccharopolyspora sp. HNM0983]|uniref:ABC transporter substrate-binding protein n=1 Tax=Saccharopolyspora montiporae TaxID=2781240 RepID=A0A929BFL4_9PSEU|nr:ABC transporter substrate-binding protein [Saccharopolyspora sp. HNM0983]MBE9376542.1 ABC transporter substrate-binding protein [Saccharopolyspora sp. HNM0983]